MHTLREQMPIEIEISHMRREEVHDSSLHVGEAKEGTTQGG